MIRHINVVEGTRDTGVSESLKTVLPPGEVDIIYGDTDGDVLYKNISIRPGIKMVIANHQMHDNLREDYDIDNAPISFSYNLSQQIRNTMTSGGKWKREIKRSPGDAMLAYLPKTRGTNFISSNKRVVGVALHFSPDTFDMLFTRRPQCLRQLHSVSGNPDRKRFYHQSRISRETLLVLKQILECPYNSDTRKLYLEAKSLELVALKLAELDQVTASATQPLKQKDLDRVREAYHILLTRLDQPPGLNDLSRLVGTNRNKLNQGFKEVYGDTVFNVLRNARLSKAQSLLTETELSLSEISLLVGYSSQANFTAAFCRQFGKTPNRVRRTAVIEPCP